jgi:bacteriocin biosynthesis cyclodehydratase domain-containing protein
VRIEGDQRTGRTAARLLNAAGVGHVQFVRAPADDGAGSAGGLSSHSSRPRGVTPVIRPDLLILTGRQPIERLAQLARERIPHLAVLAGEAIGVVGPLVLPGRTACLLCLDYVRAGNDPAWPLILAQIGHKRPEPPACDAVLATAVAVQAAAQVLTAIERDPIATAAANGTLELVLPDWRWRRRTWQPHPACPCGSHTVR